MDFFIGLVTRRGLIVDETPNLFTFSMACRGISAMKHHGKPKPHTFTHFTTHKKCIRMQEPNIRSLAGMHAHEKKSSIFFIAEKIRSEVG